MDDNRIENRIFVVFNAEGFLAATYQSAAYENPETIIPADAIELTEEVWRDLYDNQSHRRYVEGQIVEYVPPPPPPPVTVLPTVTLWERLSEAEAEQVNAAMATQPFRTRQIFLTANTFRSDHELWLLLMQMATDLFGEARAAELLADPSELVANA